MMEHVRAGSHQDADTYVPWRGRLVDPATEPFAVGVSRFLSREVLLGAVAAGAVLGVVTGLLLGATAEAAPIVPAPPPVVAEPVPAECAPEARTITGRITVHRDAGDGPVGVVEVRTATPCASKRPVSAG